MPTKRVLMLALLPLVTAFIFGRVIMHDFIIFDDDLLIFENPLVWSMTPQTLWGIFTSYDPELYIPFTLLSYQFDWLISNGKPWSFHLTNLVLHIINAGLAGWFAKRLTEQYAANQSGKFLIPHSFAVGALVAFLFAVHPIQTEAVAWASSRKDLLCSLYMLATLITYLDWRQSKERLQCWLCLGLFVLALLSKATAIVVPALLIWIEFFLQKNPWQIKQVRPDKKSVALLMPFGLLSVFFAVIAWYGKQHMVSLTSHSDKVLMAFKSSAFYLEKLFWPTDLSVIYPLTDTITIQSAGFFVPIIIIVLLMIAALALRQRYPILLFGLGFFFVTVAPTFLNFSKAGEIFVASDRYVYVPSIGIFFIAAWALLQLQHRLKNWKPSLPTQHFAIAPAILILLLAGLSYRQVQYWQNSETLFVRATTLYPHSALARSNYASALSLQGKYDRAVNEYRVALEDNPDLIRTWGNLISTLGRSGRMDEAFQAATTAVNRFPASAEIHFRIGDLYAMQEDEVHAKEAYTNAILLDPAYMQKMMMRAR